MENLNPQMDEYFRNYLFSEELSIDSIILDLNLRETIKSIGGVYFKRMFEDNPCSDTLSITRLGDTIKIANYAWLKLFLNNDTTLIPACGILNYLFYQFIEGAEPNFCFGKLNAPAIRDEYYLTKQSSLQPNQSDAQKAWDFQVGLPEIKIGIIDTELDFTACDLGKTLGKNKKVRGGWNYIDNTGIFETGLLDHGTQMASIIAGYTNGTVRNGFGCAFTGISGVAGGWEDPELSIDKPGCTLFGLKVNVSEDDELESIDQVYRAIIDASTEPIKESDYKFGVQIINCSWGFSQPYTLLNDAINYAFEHGVSIVCSRGNVGNNDEDPEHSWYPSCFNPSWITSVGGHDDGSNGYISQNITTYSGFKFDFLAPSYETSIYTTIGKHYNTDYFQSCAQTSAAAAHVSGAIALLRSEFYEHPNLCNGKPESEDFENMLKAACLDLNYDSENEDINQRTFVGYDIITGWGQLKIGKIFEMLNEGYQLVHLKIENSQLDSKPNFSGTKKEKEVKTNNLFRNDCDPKIYKTQKREITGSITLPDNWEMTDNTPLFVWGRSGKTLKGGLNEEDPIIFLTGYTQVTNGDKDNGFVDGIVHNKRLVNARTFQYKLFDKETEADLYTNIPHDDNLELYFSVFGKPKPHSVNSSKDNIDFFIFPNPSNGEIEIKYNIEHIGLPIIRIYNSLGQLLFSKYLEQHIPGNYSKEITLNNLNQDLYIVEFYDGFRSHFCKLIFLK